MSVDVFLFVLRLLSASVLLVFLLALFVLLWREYQRLALQAVTTRRAYGRLIGFVAAEEEQKLIPTGKAYPLLPLTSIGRAPTNTIVLDQSFASGEHALIALRDGQWWLEDRKSRNGTRLNDELVTTPTIVTDGDIIGIGTYYFQLVLE